MRRYKLPVTTAADGTAVALFPKVAGLLQSLHYVKDGSNGFTDGVDFTITADATGETLWTEANVNASTVRYPRAPTHTTAGVAALFAAGGTAVLDKIPVSDRVKVVLAQGGNAKKGVFHLVVA